MKKSAIGVLSVLFCAGLIAAGDTAKTGKAPRKPVEISAVVANIASGSKPLSVLVVTTISKTEMLQKVEIHGDEYVTIPLQNAAALGKAMKQMAETMTFGDDKKVAGYDISVYKSDDGTISIYFKPDERFISSGQFLDPDAATLLGEALTNADSIAVWIAERATAFQK